jgi:hypothetical protein
VDETIRLDREGKGTVHVPPEMLQVPATARIKAEGFQDGIHAEFHMVVGHQVTIATEEQHIQIPWEPWSRHPFRGPDRQEGAVLIVNM